ncbi:hypothetical protein LINPERPRIM_LOCUS27841 [Linum perenne]
MRMADKAHTLLISKAKKIRDERDDCQRHLDDEQVVFVC